MVCDDAVLLVKRGLDHLEESLFLSDPVDCHLATEEPMSRVLAIALSKVEALYVCRISLQFVRENVVVVVDVPILETKTHFLINLTKSVRTLFQYLDDTMLLHLRV